MTKEELRKEATTTVEWESTPMIDRPTFINGYIVGAEPREKRIAELEKSCDETQELLDKQIEATYKLDKEIVELKEKLKPENCIEYLAKGGYVKFLCENGNEHDQLTKAKELLNELFSELNNLSELSGMSYKTKLKEQAELFLNSEVEK